MQNKILLTPVDALVEQVEKNPNISVQNLRKILNQPKDLIEKWLIVLEEYKILEVHYKGLEGFVRLKTQDIKKKEEEKSKNSELDISNLKKEFVKKAKLRNLSDENLKILWPKFVSVYETEIKEKFVETGKKKGYNDKMTNIAWEKYRGELVKF